MRLNEYQVLAKSTAQYPAHMKLSYPAIGLAGEIFEFMEKVAQFRRHRDEILAELGDILWYCAGVASDAEIDLGAEQIYNIEPRVASDFNIAKFAKPVLEGVKKCFRDDDGRLTAARQEQIENGILGLLSVLAGYAILFDSSLEEVAEANVAKLQSRQDRGVIKGDGDNR